MYNCLIKQRVKLLLLNMHSCVYLTSRMNEPLRKLCTWRQQLKVFSALPFQYFVLKIFTFPKLTQFCNMRTVMPTFCHSEGMPWYFGTSHVKRSTGCRWSHNKLIRMIQFSLRVWNNLQGDFISVFLWAFSGGRFLSSTTNCIISFSENRIAPSHYNESLSVC